MLVRLLALTLMAGLMMSTPAEAQIFHSLKEAILGKQSADGHTGRTPAVAHFVSDRGEGFILDQSSQVAPLLRFDGDDEVFQLTATPGAKGDIIFKNDVGQPVLKATRLGGMIVFSGANGNAGDPAALTGAASAFAPDHVTVTELFLHMTRSSVRVTNLCDHLVVFNADGEVDKKGGDSALPVFAETVSVAADALVQIAVQADTKRALNRLHEVHFIEGRPPSAHIDKGVLVIKVDPDKGAWGGHPSSKRIMNVVMAGSDKEMRR